MLLRPYKYILFDLADALRASGESVSFTVFLFFLWYWYYNTIVRMSKDIEIIYYIEGAQKGLQKCFVANVGTRLKTEQSFVLFVDNLFVRSLYNRSRKSRHGKCRK